MNQKPTTSHGFLLIMAMLLTSISAFADTVAQRQTHYNLKDNLAIKGYDPVSYFAGKPRKGRSEINYTHRGVVYQFATPENLEKFKASPSRYEPEYGGWCAYAFAIKAGKVKINPKSYKIIDEKLYLFYHRAPWANTLKKWNKQPDASQQKIAHAEWRKIMG